MQVYSTAGWINKHETGGAATFSMKNRVDLRGLAQANSQGPSFLAVAIALLVLYTVWGSTYLAIRVGVQTFPPFLMGAVRFAVAGGLLLVFLQVFRGVRLTIRQCVDNAIGGFFMLLGGNGLVSWACEEIPSGIATLIVAMNPLFFVAAEWLLGAWTQHKQNTLASKSIEVAQVPSLGAVVLAHLPNRWTQIGLVVGFLGLCILVAPSLASQSLSTEGLSSQGQVQLAPWRILALVGACLNWTIGSMYIRHARHAAAPMSGASIQMLAGAIFMFLASYLLGEMREFHWGQIAPEAWWSWAYLVVAGSLIGYTSFVWLMKHASPTLVSTYSYINPMIAVFLGWWILGEQVGPHVLVASVTIIAGVVMISWSKR
jgi:drug/metabolite transporter (DMT)-like permease